MCVGGRANKLYYKALGDALAQLESVADIGCGPASHVLAVNGPRLRILCDAYRANLTPNNDQGTFPLLGDARALPLKDKSVDGITLLQIIEHLPKEEGVALLCAAERVARKVVVVTTPNGFVEQGKIDGNPYQEHHSGWSIEELRNRGYKVFGYEGLKAVRKRGTSQLRWPRFIWMMLGRFGLSAPILKRYPALAFQLFAIKNLKED
jgi:hypothetical protein